MTSCARSASGWPSPSARSSAGSRSGWARPPPPPEARGRSMAAVAAPHDQAALIALAERLREAPDGVPPRALGGVAIALRAPDAAPPLHPSAQVHDHPTPRRARRLTE